MIDIHCTLQNCQSDGRRWQRILTSEREIRQRLEDMVEQLAKQHSHLEQMVRNAQAQQKELEHQNNRNQVGRYRPEMGKITIFDLDLKYHNWRSRSFG